MSTVKNTLIGLLVVTTLGGAALAWHQYQELVELRAAALTADDRTDLQKKIWDLQKKNRELQDRLTAAESHGNGDPAADVAGPTQPESARSPGGGPPNGRWRGGPFAALQRVTSTPEGQALMNAVAKDQMDSRYGPLFKTLNLSSDQADKLSALLVERQNAMRDVFAAAREQGINPRTDPDGYNKLIADAQAPINDSIRSLIGDSGESQLQNYDQTMPQRGIVNVLQQRLSTTDAPLNTSQADQLVQILANTSRQRATNPNAGWGGFGGMMDMGGGVALAGPGSPKITNDAVTQAGSVLNSEQVAALQQLQQQQKNAQQLRNLMRNGNAGAPSPAPAPASKGG